MKNNNHIFLVEDDANFGSVLKSYLEMNDFTVTWVQDGAKAFDTFLQQSFDICILDIMLPNMDGFSIAKIIKQKESEIPVIFLTAKTLKDDIIEGFKTGADDYITKPFDSDILLYKIKAILKRNYSNSENESLFIIGKYVFDSTLRVLKFENKSIRLSPKEGDLLKMLCANKNKMLTRDKALKQIWGDDGYFTARSMDVYITRLRKYLQNDPSIEIENIHGSGFILNIKET
ncbi:MAG: two-component system response regulator [Bacteroidetes bacterium GWC2_33_15]|nr:MAG: two-component system response regulator [Bacteroidetes bacterium GWA2_33_15]OFX51131.1 MAG: two-component system response regulator [Bacteroidetes bacterium GWC2_33_15]OFX66436.1 MAG: two-component system response regulator [Bacteroidetes bacterium GWB2_32_14]OFX70339.1 MAG: two-component system response regulator [Bacteroidetes bacterium GWD2_33_33]HAN17342.1 DNA-binding response regulator [Bacteroidales bacterium]